MHKFSQTKLTIWVSLLAIMVIGCHHMPNANGNEGEDIMWINHLDLLPGDPSVKTSFTALRSIVDNGLSGLDIKSTTTGDTGHPAGNKVVQMAIPTLPGYLITGVRVCYKSSNSKTFISQIRLAQVQNPPSAARVRLDDGADLTDVGPVCVDSASTSVDPKDGAILLSFRLFFGDTSDAIVIRGVGLKVIRGAGRKLKHQPKLR